MSERIQKVLARAGVASRRQVESWIREGRLAINGTPAELGARVGPRDRITLDGRPLRVREPDSDTRVVIYHRAARRSPTEAGEEREPEPVGLPMQLPRRASRRWIPVSPLPPNDSGLELLTSDGELAQKLMRGLASVDVEFALRVRGEPTEEQLARLESGVVDDETSVAVKSVEPAGGEGFNRWLKLRTRGGRARDVHRLCAAAGLELSRLIRVGFGPLRMDRGLARERVRPLTPREMSRLYELAGLESPVATKGKVRPAAGPERKRDSRAFAKRRTPGAHSRRAPR